MMEMVHYPYRQVFQGTTKMQELVVTGDVYFNGTLTFGDAAVDTLILKGRISTMTAGGSAIVIGATYTYGEGQEYRYSVTSWTGVGSSFRGSYLRASNDVAGSTKEIMGMELYGVANNVDTGGVKGLLSYAYIKGTTAKTVGPAYGVHGELSFDAGSATNTITTEASAGLFKITGGVCDTYTKLHGIIIRAGDMDGASRTYGNGILIEDDSAMSGTITWTKGISITAPCTDAISISGTQAGGIDISGTYSDHGIYIHAATFATGKRALRIGDYDTEIDMAAGEGIIRSYAKVTSGTDTSTLQFHWGFTTSTGSLIGSQMQIESHATTPGPVGVMGADVIVGIDASHFMAASVQPYDGLVGGRYKVYGDGTATCSGNVAALWLDHQMSCAVGGIESAILVTTGGTVPDAFARFQTNSGGVANIFYFDSLAAPLSASATALNGITTSHKLAVYLTGVGTIYIPVVTTGMA